MALVQGVVSMFVGDAQLLLPHAKAGRVRLIALTESTHSDLLPNIPSAPEFINALKSRTNMAFLHPKGWSRRAASCSTWKSIASPRWRKWLNACVSLGMVRAPGIAQQLCDILQANHQLWSSTIIAMGITGKYGLALPGNSGQRHVTHARSDGAGSGRQIGRAGACLEIFGARQHHGKACCLVGAEP